MAGASKQSTEELFAACGPATEEGPVDESGILVRLATKVSQVGADEEIEVLGRVKFDGESAAKSFARNVELVEGRCLAGSGCIDRGER